MIESLHGVLLDPSTYPEQGQSIDFRETHISKVYLTDTRAYKFKKSLDLGFLDFSSLDKRRHFCMEELRLNRRFCPRIYLDVVALNRDGRSYRINGPGKTVDYAVEMRRLPENRMLDVLLAEGTQDELESETDRLAEKLIQIYPALEPCREDHNGDHAQVVRTNWQENFEQTRPYIGVTIPRELFELGRRRVARLLEAFAPLMARRQESGFVRDCHGDLHSRNICMTEKICIYDCIEFNRRFRIGDIVSDLAFLLMDLEYRGHHDLSARLLEQLGPILGDREDVAGLVPFYKFYRAWVRGKVLCFLLDETNVAPSLKEQARTQAMRYFNLAFGTQAPAGLVLTCGLAGTGKTTVARALAAATGAAVLRSDVVRKELYEASDAQAAPEGFNEGLYSREKTERTYKELAARAQSALRSDRMVIVDASFSRSSERRDFERLARRLDVPFAILDIDCPEELAVQRLERRQREGGDASDATPGIYRRQAEEFERPASDGGLKIDVDTSQGVDYNVSLILARYLTMTGTT